MAEGQFAHTMQIEYDISWCLLSTAQQGDNTFSPLLSAPKKLWYIGSGVKLWGRKITYCLGSNNGKGLSGIPAGVYGAVLQLPVLTLLYGLPGALFIYLSRGS